MNALRVGLIGAGKMGLNHIRAIGGCTGATLVAVADPEVRPEHLAGQVPADCTVFADATAMLDQARLDVVHIVTPPATHLPLAMAALDRDVHVYIEKPVVEHLSEVHALLRAAETRKLAVCAGHQCLFDHAAIVGRGRLAAIGHVVHVHSHFSFRQVRQSLSPVDQAKDILPHAVYMLLDYVRAARPDLQHAEPVVAAVDADADGGVYGLVKVGDCRATFSVTLVGRPVEQYLHCTGTNGSIRVDLVRGSVVDLTGPGASLPAAVLDPYREAMKMVSRSTTGFARHIRERKFGYPGHRALCQAFYDHLRTGGPAPMTPSSIAETVAVCGEAGRALDTAHAAAEADARARLLAREQELAPAEADRGTVLVTGAAGFLGRTVVEELRRGGWPVRAVGRQLPRFAARVPGAEYRAFDLSRSVPVSELRNVTTIVHCAAETRGGQADHERNSINATRNLIEAAAAAGVQRLINISSVAVMRPPAGGATMDERTEVDDTLTRGPYVWGKAQAEKLASSLCAEAGIALRTIRLGPLVDFEAFDPPGRLGRGIGPTFVAVGPRNRTIALVDVRRAAEVLAHYVRDFDSSPPLLNLVEPSAPTRAELVARLKARRPDLRVVWVPMLLLRLVSPVMNLAQRVLLGSKQPLDIASAFTSPVYSTALAATVIEASKSSAPAPTVPVVNR